MIIIIIIIGLIALSNSSIKCNEQKSRRVRTADVLKLSLVAAEQDKTLNSSVF